MSEIFKRKVLNKIEPFLNTNDILLFYGARQVGKTTLMRYIQQQWFAHNSVFFDLEKASNLEIANKDPDLFVDYLKVYYGWDMKSKLVVFIDEIQYLSRPTKFLKYLYDNYKNLKLIVSWSSSLEIRGKLEDSLVGRLIKFEIYPLDFEEFLIFNKKDNLAAIIWKEVKFESINQELKFRYELYIKYGWYPKVVLAQGENIKKIYLLQIVQTYIQKDIKDIGKIRQIEKFNKFLIVLAWNVGGLVNMSELANTVDVSIPTLEDRLLILQNTFVIKFVKPFANNPKKEISKMPKLYFVDTGLKNAILDNWMIDGNSFENSFFQHILASGKAQKINFWRTKDKKEIDFILDGKPYEVKLHYNGKKLSALDLFEKLYGTKWAVISFQKKLNPKYEVLYPWEV